LKDSKSDSYAKKKPISLRLIRTGLWLGLLSTVLPFGIGVLSAKGLGGTQVYQSFVYTFLHLQYNGWFLFVVLGLLFNYFDENNISYSYKRANLFFLFLALAVIPSITLSLLGMDFSSYIVIPAYLSVFLLTGALVLFLFTVPCKLLLSLKHKGQWLKLYFYAFLMSFILKIVLQCLSVFPCLETFVFSNKFIIIAYLHLSLIGSISFPLLALSITKNWLPINTFVKIGSILLLSGFGITELIMVSSGLGKYHNQMLLITGSAAMALGIFLMLIGSWLNGKVYGAV
ncbi:MAG: hypothetical protein AAF969_14670, partial [Bacteroidota bacterium]